MPRPVSARCRAQRWCQTDPSRRACGDGQSQPRVYAACKPGMARGFAWGVAQISPIARCAKTARDRLHGDALFIAYQSTKNLHDCASWLRAAACHQRQLTPSEQVEPTDNMPTYRLCKPALRTVAVVLNPVPTGTAPQPKNSTAISAILPAHARHIAQRSAGG